MMSCVPPSGRTSSFGYRLMRSFFKRYSSISSNSSRLMRMLSIITLKSSALSCPSSESFLSIFFMIGGISSSSEKVIFPPTLFCNMLGKFLYPVSQDFRSSACSVFRIWDISWSCRFYGHPNLFLSSYYLLIKWSCGLVMLCAPPHQCIGLYIGYGLCIGL